MRIRKRYQNLRAAADLSSTATGGEEIAVAAAAEAAPPSYGGSEEKGEEGELHSRGHLHGEASQWRNVKRGGENGGDGSGGAGATVLKREEPSKEPSKNPIQEEVREQEVGLLERETKPKMGEKGKKRRSPAVLMEGSRCSRVNGRGWRCSQQTLVGYSLCEHHLGKGRLRSVNSVKCNDKMKRREGELQQPSEEEEMEPVKKKRKRKIGTVKARSMSSLLHQSDVSVAAAPPSSSAPAGVGFCLQ